MKKMRKICCCLILLSGLLFPLQVQGQEDVPEGVQSAYIYMMDATTQEVLLDQGGEETIYPASLTKMMTLLVACEHLTDLDKTVEITPAMVEGLAQAHASVLGYRVGDTPTVRDLMQGITIASGADCTNALAYEVSGSIDGFVDLMNQKAEEIGMTQTHFVNTTGLHDDRHVSTVEDMAKLLSAGLKNERFREIMETTEYDFGVMKSHPEGFEVQSRLHIYNQKVDGNYLILGKTGYTPQAGLCLATLSQGNGTQYILVTAKAPTYLNDLAFQDAEIILDYFRQTYQTETLFEPQVLKSTKVRYATSKNNILNYTLEQPYRLTTRIGQKMETEIKLEDAVAPIEVGDVVGKIEVRVDGELVDEVPILSNQTIHRSMLNYIMTISGEFIWKNKVFILISYGLCFGAVMIMKTHSRKSKQKSGRR